MTPHVQRGQLQIAAELASFVEDEVLPALGLDAGYFWQGYAGLIDELGPQNRTLLARRDALQQQIDAWHLGRRGQVHDAAAYEAFLRAIGYIVPEGEAFDIDTANVDAEIATLAGPQLVVPVMNARFALNAANARWGSLYDALYGTDAIDRGGERAPGANYNAARGAEVIRTAAAFLDAAIPLARGSHAEIVDFALVETAGTTGLALRLADGETTGLADPSRFAGHAGSSERRSLLFVHHGIHLELRLDRAGRIGAGSPSGLDDVIVEAALTTIQDCEDSVAAVDAEDKVAVYRNWLGLMQGTLAASFAKDGRDTTRTLAADRAYTAPDGSSFTLPGRSLLLVRNVGHLMTTDAVLDAAGNETPEGFLDALVTAACAVHDLRRTAGPRNSRAGSIYIVKPKMHGPEEVALADTLFDRVEDILGLARHTIKIGVMDEERRTTVNLRESIRAVRHRLVFINTGFLDRTGDEIHTSMLAGPVLPKDEIKAAVWLAAYEANNVQQGLLSGLAGRAQIGKGMWAKPDAMAEMVATKLAHPKAGANTAWVPSPTAAVLHAMHYHQVDVRAVQADLLGRPAPALADILTPPLLGGRNLPVELVQRQLDSNAQSILGYVVRWVDQGIGCSKVPDIDGVALMEDRATLRISAQHIANWLRHGLVDAAQVRSAFERMSVVVDAQNRHDPAYRPLAPDFGASVAFRAALELALQGERQPNGYTEPVLHRFRREAKAHVAA